MPIVLTIQEGLLAAEAEAALFARNAAPKLAKFAAGRPAPAGFVELTLPAIALATAQARQAFIERGSRIWRATGATRPCRPRR